MTPCIDEIIQEGTNKARKYLLNLTRNEMLGADVSVVYIYKLVDEYVNYPDKQGRIIYIGEANRSREATGKRFAQHISTGPSKGGDTGTIYSLSRYYWQKKRIRLQIFLIDSPAQRKNTERTLLRAHVKEFGALPICQGTTGENYKTTGLCSFAVPQEIQVLLDNTNEENRGC